MDFLSPGDVPAIVGLKEEWRPPGLSVRARSRSRVQQFSTGKTKRSYERIEILIQNRSIPGISAAAHARQKSVRTISDTLTAYSCANTSNVPISRSRSSDQYRNQVAHKPFWRAYLIAIVELRDDLTDRAAAAFRWAAIRYGCGAALLALGEGAAREGEWRPPVVAAPT